MTAAATLFLLGLFPAFFLPALQLILLVVLGDLIWRARQIGRADLRALLDWPAVAFWQFVVFFLINALVFTALEGTPAGFRPVAIETWTGTLVASALLLLWLHLHEPAQIKQAIMRYLPAGLLVTFLIATGFFLVTPMETRITIFTPNALVPPLWFLILTVLSFCWFGQMSRRAKLLRLALFVMAGLMALYGSARLVMVAWVIAGLLLGFYVWYISQGPRRRMIFWSVALGFPALLGALVLADLAAGGLLIKRFDMFFEADRAALVRMFPRITLWPAALEIAAAHPLTGVGQINERIALQNEIGWERWLRAHQTYLSYLIAGGIPALISGLIVQTPVLRFLRRQSFAAMFPAFASLGVVLTLNCLTDSVFQSGVGVQVYMVALFVSLRASTA